MELKQKVQKRVIVTGFAGFIASHLTDRLVELGYDVTGIDDLSTGKEENINPKAHFINWDISEVYFNAKCDYLFHLAAIASVPYSMEHPTKTHRVNITGTYNILKSAKDSKVKKVIFASSCAVYGDARLPYKEDNPIHPKSPYAFQKAVGEGYMRLFDEVYGLPTISLRLFNVYGKRCDPDNPYALVISKFLKLKKEKQPLTIFGDGSQTRDFVYVNDVVDALILAMESPVHNDTINICSGKRISVNELANLISGKKTYFPAREGDVLHILGDNSKAKALLKWQPQISIKEGLKIMEE